MKISFVEVFHMGKGGSHDPLAHRESIGIRMQTDRFYRGNFVVFVDTGDSRPTPQDVVDAVNVLLESSLRDERRDRAKRWFPFIKGSGAVKIAKIKKRKTKNNIT